MRSDPPAALRSTEIETPLPFRSLTNSAFLQMLTEKDIDLRLKDGRLSINAPAGVMTDALKKELAYRKSFLTSACRSARSFHGSLVLRDPAAENRDAPLTHAQERLWLLERFQAGNAAYNIPEVFEISTPLDETILQRAVDIVVARHESLRTKIVETVDDVVQRVCSNITIPVAVIHLDLPSADDGRLKSFLREESRRPFDLSIAPLARIHLYISRDHRRFLLINLHHIIADRWSTNILYRELLSAYTALDLGREPRLPRLPVQYPDYAVWERRLSAKRMQLHLAYWQQQLSDLPEPLALPFARDPVTHPSSEGAIYSFQLTGQQTAQLRALAKQQGATLYMLLLAAYCALLNRYTGATDLCIGSPVSERSFRETEPLIGLFVNTLVMRCRIPQGADLLALLASVRDTVLDAHAHRDLPFQKVLTVAGVNAGSSQRRGSPLFNCMLAFDPLDTSSISTARTMIELDPGFAKFDLTLQLKEEADCISGWFEYRKDVASGEAIEKLAAVFQSLLGDMLAMPATPIDDFDILLPEDRQLLKAWNKTAMPFPADHTVHQLFEEQVERTSATVAIVDGKRHLTYSQLDSASSHVARLLLDAGVVKESIVGVQLPRTAEMIAALLGILKAGAAYLPIDQNCPPARIHSMLAESGCSLVLTGSTAGDWNFDFVRFLKTPDVFSLERAERVKVATSPANLAYVIYTSGSTGVPKGVAIEHHSVVSFLTWAKHHFPAEQLKGTLAATSISFDLSVFEIFLPLTTGGTVILAPDILALPDLPACREVTLATTVPSAAAAMLHSGSIPPSLRYLNLAGESLTDDLLQRLYSETHLLEIHDLYGPTETTTYSTCALRRKGEQPTIGRPIANTRVYLLDNSLSQVPIGMAGELFIAGEGVARGYLNRPELTAERFISLAHLGEEGPAYRTGDLCRFNMDGTLVFQGRQDQQVKINGFRVELGEIEAVLCSHPAVDSAVVTAPETANGTILAAAVRLTASARAAVPSFHMEDLIRHQSTYLPSHTVVRRIMSVDAFPLTANGKIDRRQFTVKMASVHPAVQEVVAPMDHLERELLMIWRAGFGDDTIGIDDDFFRAGGNSLLALRIFSDIDTILGYRLRLSILFQAPTVRRLASHLGDLHRKKS